MKTTKKNIKNTRNLSCYRKKQNRTRKRIKKNEVEYEYKIYALKWDRQELYERINKRVDIMIEQGLIDEVKEIYQKYQSFPTAMQGLGYKEVVEYLEGKISKDDMIEK